MQLQTLQTQIKDKQLQSLYVFTGEEVVIQNIYIHKMAKIANLEISYIDNFKQISNKSSVFDIFNNQKKLYVIIDDTEFAKSEKAWQIALEKQDSILIFKYNNLDKRGKFTKQFEDYIIEFNKLSTEVLTKYIQKEIPLNTINCNKLISICNNSYNQILLEIDKMQNFSQYYTKDDLMYDKIFEDLNSQGAFHKEISDITFDFVEKVVRRDIKRTYILKRKLEQIGESNLKLLSLLYMNFKTILLIQSCKSEDICKTTGLQKGQVYYNKDKINIYSTIELVNILRLIQRLEKGVKQGTIDETITIDYLLVNIL